MRYRGWKVVTSRPSRKMQDGADNAISVRSISPLYLRIDESYADNKRKASEKKREIEREKGARGYSGEEREERATDVSFWPDVLDGTIRKRLLQAKGWTSAGWLFRGSPGLNPRWRVLEGASRPVLREWESVGSAFHPIRPSSTDCDRHSPVRGVTSQSDAAANGPSFPPFPPAYPPSPLASLLPPPKKLFI